MSELILNIPQRKALRPFASYKWHANYSVATGKYYLDGDSTMRWKPDAPNNKFLITNGLIEKFHQWYHSTDLGREYLCWECHNGRRYQGYGPDGIECAACNGIGILAVPGKKP